MALELLYLQARRPNGFRGSRNRTIDRMHLLYNLEYGMPIPRTFRLHVVVAS